MKNSTNRGFTLIELLVVIAIIGLLIGLIVPGVMEKMEQAKRVQGAANLRAIGQAILEYSMAESGAFPTRGEVEATNPSWGANSIVILMKHPEKFITNKELFISPGSGAVSDKCDDIILTEDEPFDNTTRGKKCSYGYDSRHFASDPDDVALMADKVNMDDTDLPEDETRQNSKNFGTDRPGQNVLYKSGSVSWKSTTLCGYDYDGILDNIYTKNENDEGSNNEEGGKDSWVIP